MNHNLQKKLSLYWDRFGTLVILILLIFFIALFGPSQFISPSNLVQIGIQSSINIIIACGEFFAILIAGIDLSVGSVMGLVGMITAKLIVLDIMPWYVAVLIGILAGALCGIFNGL